MSDLLKMFIHTILANAVLFAESALGAGKGEEKKKWVMAHTQTTLDRMLPAIGLSTGDTAQTAITDYVSWLTDQIVGSHNATGAFKSKEKKVSAAEKR